MSPYVPTVIESFPKSLSNAFRPHPKGETPTTDQASAAPRHEHIPERVVSVEGTDVNVPERSAEPVATAVRREVCRRLCRLP